MKTLHLSAAVGAVAIGLCAHGSAYAQADEAASAAQFEPIVVTARRVEENLQSVPVAVTALGSDALEQRQITEANDLQFSVPSLQVRPNLSAPSIPQFQLRGQRQNGFTDPNVVIYVDGVSQGARALAYYDLQSIQALKGPQGTLFGRNSVGGAVVFTTNNPTHDFEGNLSVDVGNYDYVAATGMLNIPIVDGKAALRVAGRIERRDGPFKNILPGEQDLGDRHNEGFRAKLLLTPSDRLESVFMVDGIWRDEIPNPPIMEAARFTGYGIFNSQVVELQSIAGGGVASVGLDDGAPIIRREGSPFATAAFTGIDRTIPVGPYESLVGSGAVSKVYGFQNTTSYELSDSITLRNIIGYRYDKSQDNNNPSGAPGFTIDLAPFFGLPDPFPGNFVNNNTPQEQFDKVFSEEFQVIGKTDNLDFLLGAFYSHSNLRYSNVTTAGAGSPIDRTIFFDQYGGFGRKAQALKTISDTYAIFGQATYDFSSIGLEGLKFTGGLRYTWDKRDFTGLNSLSFGDNTIPPVYELGEVCLYANGTGTSASAVSTATECEIFGSNTYKALNWTASLEYQASPDTLIYLASRRGFKSGGIAPTANLDFAIFGKEQLTDFELGVKHQGYLGSVPYRLNVAGYLGKYKDIQTQAVLRFCANPALDPATCPANVELLIFNVGSADIGGVELEGSIIPFPDLTIDFAYNYQYTKYGNDSVIPSNNAVGPISNSNPLDLTTGTSLAGGKFAGLPEHQFSVAATYRASFVPESFADVSLSMNYAYLGRAIGRRSQGILAIPGFGVANAKLAFDSLFESQTSVSFWAKNLFDKQYRTRCTDNLNSIGYQSCIWGDPATYGLTVSTKF